MLRIVVFVLDADVSRVLIIVFLVLEVVPVPSQSRSFLLQNLELRGPSGKSSLLLVRLLHEVLVVRHLDCV